MPTVAPADSTLALRDPSSSWPLGRIAAFLLLGLLVLLPGCGQESGTGKGSADSTAIGSTTDEPKASAEGSAESATSDDDATAAESDAAPANRADRSTGSADEAAGVGTRETREKLTAVDATTAVRADLVVPVVAEGRIRARREAEIRAEIGGILERVQVAEGQSVSRGQLLARLDGREYQVAIAEARSRYLQALGQIVIEDETVESPADSGALGAELERLWEEERVGRLTREDRLAKQRALEMAALQEGAFRRDLVEARTGLSAAKADEERARLNLERTEIRAPFSGVVTGLTWVSGQRLAAGETLCAIVDNVEVEAEVGVLESDLRGLEVGDRALLVVPALAETLAATVDVISPRIDPETRTCEVLIRYRSADGSLRPGMFVRASIAGETFTDRLLVPRAAILTRDGRPLLFRIDGERARWVYVTLGEQNDHLVEIAKVLQGGPLEAGTRVIVSDHLTLTDDAKVEIRKTLPVQDPWSRAGTEG